MPTWRLSNQILSCAKTAFSSATGEHLPRFRIWIEPVSHQDAGTFAEEIPGPDQPDQQGQGVLNGRTRTKLKLARVFLKHPTPHTWLLQAAMCTEMHILYFPSHFCTSYLSR